MSIKKVLIANRGEIALRIIRTLKEMGIASVAVYSEADRDSLHVKMADQAFCIGPADSRQSYLHIPNLISTAEVTGADAIHPGYGFLAESSEFAKICAEHGFIFIGPSPEAISSLGDKAVARRIMIEAGVPVVPGSEPLCSAEEATAQAKKAGLPILLKAAGGGGGRGMRLVHRLDDVADAWASARHEAANAFNNDVVYLEKFVEASRHIEVQILADHHGTVVDIGERDCSLQRLHQKLIEESPAPFLHPEKRNELCKVACKAAKAAGYTSAGTVEFLFDIKSENFYFMEMNSRVQVEHPVTEMVSGIDIIREQILVAAGQPLSFDRDKLQFTGHAIECRINAENTKKNFMPSCGVVSQFIPPGGFGVRVDSHMYSGCVVPPWYDAMIGKIITHGKTREEAIIRMERALSETIIEGIETVIPLQLRLLACPEFRQSAVHTKFVEELLDQDE